MINIKLHTSFLLRKLASDVLNSIIDSSEEYEYTITDGGKPEGEGWEKTPQARVPHSYRRKKQHSTNTSNPSQIKKWSKPDHLKVAFSEIPENTQMAMDEFIVENNNMLEYCDYLDFSPELSHLIASKLGDDYLESEPAELIRDFGGTGYMKGKDTRKELSNLACHHFNVEPDGFGLKKLENVDENSLDEFSTFVKANQMSAYLSGFVDEDGFITAYRGTDDQYENGKYRGSNCESWAIDPMNAFSDAKTIIKARIPVERVIGCFAGNNGLYGCGETEITICTQGLDLECEDLLEKTDKSIDSRCNIGKNERPKAGERIKNNILRMKKMQSRPESS